MGLAVAGGIIVVGGVVIVLLGLKTWKWHHLTAMFFVWAFAVTFMCRAAISLKARAAWIDAYETNLKTLEKERETTYVLSKGKPDLINQDPSVRSENARLHRELLSRGRVWRNCKEGANSPAGNNLHQVTLTLPAGPAPGFSIDAAQQQGQVVYAFVETKYTLEPNNTLVQDYKVPWVYMGEFRVTNVNNLNVTLQSTEPLDAEQKQAFGQENGAATWALYEQLPIDDHFVYGDGKRTQGGYFGTIDKDKINKIFGFKNLPKANYGAVYDDFERDGSELNDESDAPEENVWVRLKFLRQKSIQVDSGQAATLDGSDFDSQGLAKNPALKHGATPQELNVTVKVGEEIVVLKAEADAMRAEQPPLVEKIGKAIYVRSLRDYQFIFKDQRRLRVKQDRELADIQAKLAMVNDQVAKVTRLNEIAKDENQKLKQDLANFTKARDAITAFRKKMEALRDSMVGQLQQLYDANLQMGKRIAQYQAAATSEINRRTNAAATASK